MSEELITVATTYDIIEAEFLRNHLEAEEFQVYLADENIVGVYGLLANAVGGIKIRVPSDEAEDALIFIDELRNAEIVEEEMENVDTGYGWCERCAGRDLSARREALGFKGILLFFGIPTVVPKRRLICNDCGNVKIDE